MRVIDLSTLSMVGGSGIAESKIPIWWSDGTYASGSTGSSNTTYYFIWDGNSAFQSPQPASSLFTLSTSWPNNIKFAFEATLSAASSYSISAALYDTTSGEILSSNMGIQSTSMTVVRSGKFSLTSGHSFNVGVNVWNGSSSGTGYISDASLIVFP